MEEVVRINNLTKEFRKARGIYDINISIYSGEIFGLFGIKGSGKTTLLRHLVGQLKNEKGTCSILSMDVRKNSAKLKEHMIYVPEGVINLQESLRTSYFGWLTTSMKEKDILILDEPFSKIDTAGKAMYIECIRQLNCLGKTIIITSEYYSELERICDRIGLIHNGRNVNTVSKVLYNEEQERIYRVGFHKQEEYNLFLNTCSCDVVNKNKQYNSLLLKITIENIHLLFQELKSYDVRNIDFVPYTFKWYYSEDKIKINL